MPLLTDYGEGGEGSPVPVPKPDDVSPLRRFTLFLEPPRAKAGSKGTGIRVVFYAYTIPLREDMRMIARQVADISKNDIRDWKESEEGFRILVYEDDGEDYEREEAFFEVARPDGTIDIYRLEGGRLVPDN